MRLVRPSSPLNVLGDGGKLIGFSEKPGIGRQLSNPPVTKPDVTTRPIQGQLSACSPTKTLGTALYT